MKMEDDVQYILSQNFMLIDCEAIQNGNHHCIRRMFILAKDGFSSLSREFRPCIDYTDLCEKDRKTFIYCKRNIHKLEYYPSAYADRCRNSLAIIKDFITTNNINLLLYKGGIIEKRLAEKLNIASYNIEKVGAPKVDSHDPEVEVNTHWNFLLQRGCILNLL